MPTWDELKKERDGHTSAGKLHPEDIRVGLWPKVTGYGFDADGEIVRVYQSFGVHAGEIAYGDPTRKEVRFERTVVGRAIFAPNHTP